MRPKSAFGKAILLVLAGVPFVFSACGGGSAVKSDPAPVAESPAAASAPSTAAGPKETPLARKYDRIVFQKFEFEPAIETDYPGAVAECEKSALEAVIAAKIFASAARETAGEKGSGTLLAKARVTNLRIVSPAARMWGGAFAGSSEMSLQLKLTDASTGALVREKELSTNNNPWAAAWTWGNSDRSLPTDLGRMVAEYLGSIQPQNGKIADPTPAKAEKAIPESKKSETKTETASAVKEQPKPAPAPSEKLSPPPQAAQTFVVIKEASLRSAANTRSKVLSTLKKGTKVEYLGKSGTWLNVKLSTGVTGWVSNSLVTEQK
jgi:hypothetical protein